MMDHRPRAFNGHHLRRGRVQAHRDARHDSESTATATSQRPQKVTVLADTGVHKVSVCRHDIHRHNVVSAKPVRTDQWTMASTQAVTHWPNSVTHATNNQHIVI